VVTVKLGYMTVMTQHGINDTMKDIFFDIVGAIFAATWCTVYLSEISYKLEHKLEEFSNRNSDDDFEQK
jgi:hypothetical protein